MLTGSSSSYLGQDYLQPLPTTLDAKNSPLALLAATCNNIGKDESAKAIIPPIERKERREKDASQSLSPERTHRHDNKDRAGLSSPKDHHSRSPSSQIDVCSPSKHNSDRSRSPSRRGSISPRSPARHSVHNVGGGHDIIKSNNNIASKISLNCGSLSVEINHKESQHGSSSNSSSSNHRSSPSPFTAPSAGLLPPSSSKTGSVPPSLPHHTGLLSTYYPHLGLPGYALLPQSPLAGSNPLLAAHKLAASESTPHIPVTYATVKTASGASTLVPVCADPYCVQCKLSMQSAQLAPAAGSQYSRDKVAHHGLPSTAGLHHSLAGLYNGLSSSSGSSSSAAALAASLYGAAHSHPAAETGHHSSPTAGSSSTLVCNWVGGGKYCGERFSSSEELMTHLRSHTSSLEQSSLHSASLVAAAAAAAAASSGSSPYAGLIHPSLGPLSHLYPPSVSPNSSSLRSASAFSGRSVSPNSILSASSRFHPYLKSPLSGLGSTFPPTSLPGVTPPLGPYPSSLYALPGSRLGALVP